MIATPKKAFSWKSAIFLSLGAGLLIAGLLAFMQVRSLAIQSYQGAAQAMPAEGAGTTATTTPAAVLISSFEIPAKPVRLLVPAIGVDTAIQSVGLSWRNDGSMGVPTNFTDVAWYNKGPLPGAPGNAVIAGHLDGKDVPRAVFYDLGKLQPGDLVSVVDKDGRTIQFRVIATRTYAYTDSAAEVFIGDASKARLNLITCGGNWDKTKKTYDQRIVVFTELVAPGE